MGLPHKAVWSLMLMLPLAGIIFSALAIGHAQEEIMLSKMHLTYAARFNINGSLSPDLRGVYAQVIPAESEVYRTYFNKPETPWLKTASVIFSLAIAVNLHLLQLTIRRKRSAMKMQEISALMMTTGGTILFAGTNSLYSEPSLAVFVIAYPGIAYLAYTHWERVRAQLHKD
jgi:hypothetical protein